MKKLTCLLFFCNCFFIIQSQTITTVAGNGEAGFAGDDNSAVASQINQPFGLCLDATGNLFLGELKTPRVRQIGVDGLIFTLAGTDSIGYSNDGDTAKKAKLSLAPGLAVDGLGNVYFTDFDNARIRKISTNGIITTIAGTGVAGYSGDGGTASSAHISTPCGLTIDVSGNIYFTQRNNNVIRKIDNSGIISTIAGTGGMGYSGDQGSATAAELSLPQALTVDGLGNIYVVDAGNHCIRKVDIGSGIIITVAGNGTSGYSGDGGLAISAQLSSPQGVAVDASGNIYISDFSNNAIRKVDSSGNISTLAGGGGPGFSGDDGPANRAVLNGPIGIAATPTGAVYFADALNHRIRVIK